MITITQAYQETGLSEDRMRQFCKKEGIEWKVVRKLNQSGRWTKGDNITEFTDRQYAKLKNTMHEARNVNKN